MDIAQRFSEEQRSTFLSRDRYGLSDSERALRWTHRPPFWGEPLRNHGLDLATASFPDLLHRRLDQIDLAKVVLARLDLVRVRVAIVGGAAFQDIRHKHIAAT